MDLVERSTSERDLSARAALVPAATLSVSPYKALSFWTRRKRRRGRKRFQPWKREKKTFRRRKIYTSSSNHPLVAFILVSFFFPLRYFCLKVEGFDLELYEPCSNRFPARFLSLFSSFVCRVSFHSRTELFKPYAKLGCRERRIMDVIIALTSVEEKKKRG